MFIKLVSPQLLKPLVALLIFSVVLFAGCSEAPEQKLMTQKAQAVKLVAVADTPKLINHTFPAQVSAVKTVDVSFEVNGRLLNNNLQTGTLVKRGDVLASIDPTPFNQVVQEASARLTQAKRNLDRTLATYEKKLISQSDMDSAKTTFELAEIALQKAQQDLSYTTLRAPFDAQISERLVDNNSYVTAGQMIARVQDVSRYYFNINVPERIVSGHKAGSALTASAYIISAPNKQFELEYVEHDTQPDPVTQTYKVVFAAYSTDVGLTPGARAAVKVSVGSNTLSDALLVPITALVGDKTQGFHLWRYVEQSNSVEKVKVQVEQIENGLAVVVGELNKGQFVVAAGANKMRADLSVKPYRAEL